MNDPIVDVDSPIYWQRKFGESQARLAEAERERDRLRGYWQRVLRQSEDCEAIVFDYEELQRIMLECRTPDSADAAPHDVVFKDFDDPIAACGAMKLERDALRYRWLRSHAAVETENGPWAVKWTEECPMREAGSTVPLIGDELDDAVDIAIASAEVGP